MEIVQTNEGDIKDKGTTPAQPTEPVNTPAPVEPAPAPKPTDDPAAEPTKATEPTSEPTAPVEPAKEMSAEQFELYNETLRRVSKTAKSGLETRYNAFEDAEVKASIKAQIMAGEKPDIKSIASAVVTRLTPKVEPPTEPVKPTEPKTQPDEVAELKAELALIKAGIVPERLEAAKKLFIAEGGDPEKAPEFAEKYPEWKAGANNAGVSFTKAPPLAGKTAPSPHSQPVLNDFEKKVAAARKKAGLDKN